ncbi:MAG: helix-turn-helix transcriptional regulator [Cytophagaceae bacterium]|nr:helix-turn-helix transcriptional regulator [Cytophagaceae bacterium]
MKTGEKIRQLRLQKGYSQEAMADSLGLSTTAYGDIERGKTDLTLTRLAQITDALGITSLDILGADADETDALRQQIERLNDRLEKQELNLEKLRLEAAYWKEKYDQRVNLELFGATQTHRERQRIGFK